MILLQRHSTILFWKYIIDATLLNLVYWVKDELSHGRVIQLPQLNQ